MISFELSALCALLCVTCHNDLKFPVAIFQLSESSELIRPVSNQRQVTLDSLDSAMASQSFRCFLALASAICLPGLVECVPNENQWWNPRFHSFEICDYIEKWSGKVTRDDMSLIGV